MTETSSTPGGLDPQRSPEGSWEPLGRHPRTRVIITRHQPERQQPFGTIEDLGAGRLALHVTEPWPYTDPAQAMGLAVRLRPAVEVEFVGPSTRATRPAKAAVQACWTEMTRRARREQLEAGLVDERVRCGEPARDGVPCRQPAGWATDTPGVGPCSLHGGTRIWRTERERRLHEQVNVVAELARKAHESGVPLSLEERLAGALALREVLIARGAVKRPRRRGPDAGTGEEQ